MLYKQNLFQPSYKQMEAVRVYRVFCNHCNMKAYSLEGEVRYDFIDRLTKAGWKVPTNYSNDLVLCPDCLSKNLKLKGKEEHEG